MATTTSSVNVQELIQALMDTYKSLLDRFFALYESVTTGVLQSGASAALNGEAEEILRVIVQDTGKAIEHVLSLQEQLQVAIVESYFTAQD